MAIFDDFSGDLSKWTAVYGSGWAINESDELYTADQSGMDYRINYTDESPADNDHWVKVKLFITGNTWPGPVLRASSSGNCYVVRFWSSQAHWQVMNSNGSAVETIQSLSFSISSGDVIGVLVIGTGNDTVLKLWSNPSGDSPSDWGEPDVTFTNNPSNPVDSGDYVGALVCNLSGGNGRFDDFYGGPVAVPSGYTPRVIMIT